MLIESYNENKKVELSGINSNDQKEIENQEESEVPHYPRVGFFKLQYTYANKADIALICFACLGSVIAGASMPLISLLLGQVINQFNGTIEISEVPRLVQGLIVNFILAGVGVLIGSFMMIFFPDFNCCSVIFL